MYKIRFGFFNLLAGLTLIGFLTVCGSLPAGADGPMVPAPKLPPPPTPIYGTFSFSGTAGGISVNASADIDSGSVTGTLSLYGNSQTPNVSVSAFEGAFWNATTGWAAGMGTVQESFGPMQYLVPCIMEVVVTQSNTSATTLGWLVVSTDVTLGSHWPIGTVLWTSGLNTDGSIYENTFFGSASITIDGGG